METSSLDALSLVLGVTVVSSSIGFASDSPTTDACGGLGLGVSMCSVAPTASALHPAV